MDPTTHIRAVTPTKILEQAGAFARSMALRAAIELELCDALDEGLDTAQKLAQNTKTSVRGMEMLLDALVAMELLTKEGETYQLTTEASTYLVQSKPTYLGELVEQRVRDVVAFEHLAESVATGKPWPDWGVQHGGIENYFADMVPGLYVLHEPDARRVARHLFRGQIGNAARVLDLGAGSGIWGIALAQQNALATVVALDTPDVLEVTRQFVEGHKLEAQFEYHEGDLLSTDLGENQFDVVILGQICHMFSSEQNQLLFRRVARSLKPGGRALLTSPLVDDKRLHPTSTLLTDLTLLLSTEGGRSHTPAEYRGWLAGAGFGSSEMLDLHDMLALVAIK
jgi:2-polyprenyl-3-methyl-5-hydroxy-6-metoxy-1,4-benzoquinol methylase